MSQWWTVQHYEENEATVRLNEGELLSYDPIERIKHLEDALRQTIPIIDDLVQCPLGQNEQDLERTREVLKIAKEALNELPKMRK